MKFITHPGLRLEITFDLLFDFILKVQITDMIVFLGFRSPKKPLVSPCPSVHPSKVRNPVQCQDIKHFEKMILLCTVGRRYGDGV